MPVQDLFKPLRFKRGPELKNRILLAPLTNWQSNPDGTSTEHEEKWLRRCAAGGFSMVMTCATHIHPFGQAFPGQMGIFSDKHLDGLRRIADTIRDNGGVSSVQLHHGGARVSPEYGGQVVGPSPIPGTGVRGLSLREVEELRDDFILAAKRAERAGFDGVEVHAAFGWIPMQFLSPVFNRRTDRYGGSLDNRARFLFEVIDGIREACRPDFQIGLRISMERYGVALSEMQLVAARAIQEETIDYLDLALWDYRKLAQESPFTGRTFLSVFTELPRNSVRIGASGHIMTVTQAAEALEAGCDFVMLGKAAIVDPDFPRRVEKDANYRLPNLPVTESYLRQSGLSDKFIDYMRTWPGFVASL
ncbi:NADH:flavin oxidoreductase/NADH oxidase [Aspergillus steynii IBT 23096]|uniref:NADH:flavin oxidoreductase/NADH oxidase n=1 Tax=Aspergillus steynii IBT 23096 TaxID=1392250 RepID=A0A2I2GM34_9EURO|nr:NADH:flavin oxidoreductase/NADH oxidase [Aspergillus steynii IBT 23096]PLB53934.1 NADH:flavin oxidoreductase/NADH oxidase [Aspergillus steynii IBT 23096]